MSYRLDTLARQIGTRLLRDGCLYAGDHLDVGTSAPKIRTSHLPPPVSRAAITRFIQLCLRAIFPEFNKCRQDDEQYRIKPIEDITDVVAEIGAILKEQLLIANEAERHELERERCARLQRSVPPTNELHPPKLLADDKGGASPAPLSSIPLAERYASPVDAIVGEFLKRLPKIQVLLNTDVDAVLEKDVATSSRTEVVLAYPSIVLLTHHRIAHELFLLGVPALMTRLISEIGHSLTGIDIHPHTQIGHHCFIDHGTGIVIGGTAIIGNFVSIYQGVTLGAKSFRVDSETGLRIKNLPRHPIVEDHVTLYANCCVLGRVTIGRYSTIGGNVFVTKDVPPGSTVVQGKATVSAGPVGPTGGASGAAAEFALMQQGSGI